MNHDSLADYPFPSSRRVVLSTRGMVATSQTLAAQAGLGVLAHGGKRLDDAGYRRLERNRVTASCCLEGSVNRANMVEESSVLADLEVPTAAVVLMERR